MRENGFALLITLIALAVLSMLALYMSFGATTEVVISDNYEAELRAACAARAGLNHARELMRGLATDDLLRGPDGVYTGTSAYRAQARAFSFRNPVTWQAGRTLDLLDPASAVAGQPDDGTVSTGRYGSSPGIVLIPQAGIAQTAPDPYGSGTLTLSRYFVKITDNNGEASELAKDPADNPFVDGDGIVIARSLGVAATIRETTGATVRRNTVVTVEGRFKFGRTFLLDAPAVVLGDSVVPAAAALFDGNTFLINGGLANPGIGVIDVDDGNASNPVPMLTFQLTPDQRSRVAGEGLSPSIVDVTNAVRADADKLLLLSPAWLWNFLNTTAPGSADLLFAGNQLWSGGSAPDIGSYDLMQPSQDPSQHPKVTVVQGDLAVNGDVSGAGILVVTGRLSGTGRLVFNGLVLVVGAGAVDMSGLSLVVSGGILVANVGGGGGTPAFGTPKLTVSAGSQLLMDAAALQMAVRLLPVMQIGWRDIRSTLDP
jgi:hypothetical protein